MQRPFAVIVSALVVACGSSSATLTPPPPPSPGAAATITLATGDGQTGPAGSALPAALTVLVKDAAGLPVPGVVVHAAVDSGGGSLATTTATTGSNGIATFGTWTLGAGGGVTNVVSVTVTGLSAVKFHAQSASVAQRPLFTNLAVTAAGGTFRYTKAGDPLDGLTLTVPPGAYPTATTWTITTDSTILPVLPTGFTLVGAPIRVSSGQGYAASAITITMPMSLGAGTAVAPFYFNQVTKQLEPIALTDVTSASATLAALHFSGDLASWRTPTAGLRSAAGLRTFGDIFIVWVKASTADLKGTFTTTYAPGVDDWEFTNYGDFISPQGDCEGMGLTAVYYHYFKKSTLGQLYHKYDQNVANQWDNIQGIRFTGSVQGDYAARWKLGVESVSLLQSGAKARGADLATLVSNAFMITLKLTGKPLLFALKGTIGGHALVAYAGTSDGTTTVISFQDPNFPTAARTMTFVSGVLTPVTLALNASSGSDAFTEAYPLGVTAEVPLYQIDSRWTDFVAGTSGHDRYPSNTTWKYYDFESGTYKLLPSTLNSNWHQFFASIVCTDCPVAAVTDGSQRQAVAIYDQTGANALPLIGGSVALTPGQNVFVLEALAAPADDPTHTGFLEAITGVTINFTPVASTATMNVVTGSGQRPASVTGEVVPKGSSLALVTAFKTDGGFAFNEATNWTTSNPTIATVNATSGVVTGVLQGNATITGRSTSNSAVSASVVVVVTGPNNNPPATMQITPTTWTMHVGENKQFTATLLDASGNPTSVPAGLSIGYAVDVSAYAGVFPTTGLVSAFGAGTTAVRAFLTGIGAPTISAAATLTVIP